MDIQNLLITLVDSNNSIEWRRNLWKIWKKEWYSLHILMDFFHDSLFQDGGVSFLNTVARCEEQNFYELAMALDLAGFDFPAYALFWILNDGHNDDPSIVKDLLEYDPDTIHKFWPDIEKIIFD